MLFRKLLWNVAAVLLLCLVPVRSWALTSEQVLQQAAPSLVALHAMDAGGSGKQIGNGVVIRPGQVITSCSLVEGQGGYAIHSSGRVFPATLLVADHHKDLCLLAVEGLVAPPVRRGATDDLFMQESAWAVGMRGGCATVDEGVVIQLRGGQPPLIETTVLAAPETVGSGLFDREGRCIGISTVFREEGLELYFTVPVEWLDQLTAADQAGAGGNRLHWLKRAVALEEIGSWERLHDWSRQWSTALPEDAVAWHTLGYACIVRKQLDEALGAFQQTVRIDPGDIDGWSNLGYVYTDLQRYPEAISSYREVIRINPEDVETWSNLGVVYKASGNPEEAMKAINELRRLNENRAQELLRHIQEY